MKFTDLLKPRHKTIEVCGIKLQIKSPNWAELDELQARSAKIGNESGPIIDLCGHILDNFVLDETGSKIVFEAGQSVADLPVDFCLELINSVGAVASSAVPSAEDAKKK